MTVMLTTVRTIARLAAAALFLFVGAFVVSEDWRKAELSSHESLMLTLLSACLIGFLLQCCPPHRQRRRVTAGAILSVVSMSGFYLANYLSSGRWPGGWVFPLLFLPGLIELVTNAFQRRDSRSEE